MVLHLGGLQWKTYLVWQPLSGYQLQRGKILWDRQSLSLRPPGEVLQDPSSRVVTVWEGSGLRGLHHLLQIVIPCEVPSVPQIAEVMHQSEGENRSGSSPFLPSGSGAAVGVWRHTAQFEV